MSLQDLEIPTDEFVRRFSLRGGMLMWLLGAGASASGGVPTAGDMIWEFKQQLYISQRRVSPALVSDLASPFVRERLQSFIDSSSGMPKVGDGDEYSRLFETVYPSEGDRRTFIDTKLAGAKPSFGHLALASLMKSGLAGVVWTTNFDPLIADASAKVYDSTGALTTVDLNNPQLAEECFAENRRPVEIKLHGDFRSRQLKNTPDELRTQDAKMRALLLRKCKEGGLIVCGYSGRDTSIMETLGEAVAQGSSFPNGLFWLQRSGDDLSAPVRELIAAAKERGIDAGVVPIENFDEILRDVVRMCPSIDTSHLEDFGKDRIRCSDATMPIGRVGFPVLRYNAILVEQTPTVARRIVCDVGGAKEVRDLTVASGLTLLTARVRAGVLAYATDSDVRKVFEDFKITEFDLHPIEQKRLRYDSAERGLLRRALSYAVARNRSLDINHHRDGDVLVPSLPTDTCWAPLKKIVGSLHGTTSEGNLVWKEGVGLRLDWADDKLWLLIEPRTVFENQTAETKGIAASFSRERTATRYNRKLNDLIDFWTKHIVGDGSPLKSLGIADGVDASFKLSQVNGYSRRIGS